MTTHCHYHPEPVGKEHNHFHEHKGRGGWAWHAHPHCHDRTINRAVSEECLQRQRWRYFVKAYMRAGVPEDIARRRADARVFHNKKGGIK